MRTYGNAVIYFNNEIAGIELYEAATGNTSGQNGFSQANAVQELLATIISTMEGFEVKQSGEHQKRDTIMANAAKKFRTGQSELRGELSKLETSLATIAASLATMSQTHKRTQPHRGEVQSI